MVCPLQEVMNGGDDDDGLNCWVSGKRRASRVVPSSIPTQSCQPDSFPLTRQRPDQSKDSTIHSHSLPRRRQELLVSTCPDIGVFTGKVSPGPSENAIFSSLIRGIYLSILSLCGQSEDFSKAIE